MVVQHNISAMNANRYFGINNSGLSKSLEKLSSGYSINRAGDNAAGLAVSEKMRSQIAGLTQGVKNAEDGISMIQTFEGALTETDAILQRMKTLATQSANGTYQDDVDRDAIQLEFDQLNDELNQIADTDFNGVTALNGGQMADGTSAKTANSGDSTLVTPDGNPKDYAGTSSSINYSTITGNTTKDSVSHSNAYGQATNNLTYTSTITLQVGARSKDAVNFTFAYKSNGIGMLSANMDCSARGLGTDKLDLTSQKSANHAIDQIGNAINKVSMVRATFGAIQNRLEHKIDNMNVTKENITSAESRIRDTDMAQEMTNFTKNQILSQASQAMLAQANQLPQGVLQLLG
ncbi:MAG: flagellin [Huintestinicola sp.]|uniref:flagellin N-terminal helical domain-containing protein n=1 Tax=Huintestinicola sp. TaxID=2981661 RepID=UPI003F074207